MKGRTIQHYNNGNLRQINIQVSDRMGNSKRQIWVGQTKDGKNTEVIPNLFQPWQTRDRRTNWDIRETASAIAHHGIVWEWRWYGIQGFWVRWWDQNKWRKHNQCHNQLEQATRGAGQGQNQQQKGRGGRSIWNPSYPRINTDVGRNFEGCEDSMKDHTGVTNIYYLVIPRERANQLTNPPE